MLHATINLSALLLLFILHALAEPAVHVVYQKHLKYIEVGLGTSRISQRLKARIDYASSGHLVVLDVECGRSALGTALCPRYCRNDYFYTTFCNPLCRRLTPFDRTFFCGKDGYLPRGFNATQSSTFALTNHSLKWSTSSLSARQMYGEFGGDEMSIYRSEDDDRPKAYGRVEFLMGRLMHASYLGDEYTAIFGLLPSSTNLIVQLHRKRQIPNAQITFFRNHDRHIIPRFGVQLGRLEREDSCHDWSHHKPVREDSWILKANFASMNGRRYEGDSFVIINPHSDLIRAPADFIDELLRERILFKPSRAEKSRFWCLGYLYALERPLNLRFRFNERTLEFGARFLHDTVHNKTHGCSNVELVDRARGERRPYADTANWQLSYAFIQYGFCLGLDYGSGRIGLAEQGASV